MVLRAGRQHRGEDRPVRSDFIVKAEHTECSGESAGVRETKGSDRTQTDGPVITEMGKVPVEHTPELAALQDRVFQAAHRACAKAQRQECTSWVRGTERTKLEE